MKRLLLILCLGLMLAPASTAAAKPKKLAKVTKNELVLATGIYFVGTTATLHADSLPALDAAAKILTRNKKMKLRIEVHTDGLGSSSYNRRISQARANAIAKYLAKQGVRAKRLDPKGYGEDRPIASNQTAAGRAKNRRITLVIVDR